MNLKRMEYPRPQLRREDWMPLNGVWEFEFDDEDDGIARGLYRGESNLSSEICVPFTHEYEASGIGDRAHHRVLWYRRTFSVGKECADKRALLCFNGVDHRCDIWVNGMHVLTHTGGFTPFQTDITSFLRTENVIVVRCEDALDPTTVRGKQSWKQKGFGCWYVPNSGIWQSVWIDFFGEDCLDAYSLIPDIDTCSFGGELKTLRSEADGVRFTVSYRGEKVKVQTLSLDGKYTRYCVRLMEMDLVDGSFLWTPENPNLFDVKIELFKGGAVVDTTFTRFGMRKISINPDGRICLNNRPYYQRLILDQGYWKESGLTPPSAEALKRDIELAKAMGFNGARKHQKFEDPYFYYYAEELGFLTWCEMPSAYYFNADEQLALSQEWQQIVMAARNFTSVICYVPLNESWGVQKMLNNKQQLDFARSLYYVTKAQDDSRLVSTNDGWENPDDTDIVTIHDYAYDGKDFGTKYRPDTVDSVYPSSRKLMAEGCAYRGQPVLFSEFGGIAMKSAEKDGDWGYNSGAQNKEEFYARYGNLMGSLASMWFQGFCYTQLTDVQQEVNGLLDHNHEPKFDLHILNRLTRNEPE